MRGRKVGLLGGSFNPPHGGHRQISLQALKRLELDEVWWLVSPGNPLKSLEGLASLEQRVADCERLMRHPNVRVTALEARLGLRYTYEVIAALQRLYPSTRFVWLMGADNLKQFHRWRRWREIARLVPFAVLERGGETRMLSALRSPAAGRLAKYRLPMGRERELSTASPPVWGWLSLPRSRASSTELRKNRAITDKSLIIGS